MPETIEIQPDSRPPMQVKDQVRAGLRNMVQKALRYAAGLLRAEVDLSGGTSIKP